MGAPWGTKVAGGGGGLVLAGGASRKAPRAVRGELAEAAGASRRALDVRLPV